MSEPKFQHLKARVEQGLLVLEMIDEEFHGEDLAEDLWLEAAAILSQHEEKQVILDFHNVKYMATPAIRILLRLRRKLLDKSSRLVICAIDPMISEILTTTHLIKTAGTNIVIFETAEDVPAAVALMKKQQPKK